MQIYARAEILPAACSNGEAFQLHLKMLKKRGRRLAEATLFQVVVGLDDFLEPVFSSPVAPVCVGVKLLHKLFVAGLYVVHRGSLVKTKLQQGLFLCIAWQTAPAALRRLFIRVIFFEKPKSVGKRWVSLESGAAGALRIHAHFPGWAVSGPILLLVSAYLFLGHIGEEIVVFVVFADMALTEPGVLALRMTAFGGPVGSRRGATRPFAGTIGLFSFLLFLRRDPDRIEIF